jgi:hypothetical protein
MTSFADERARGLDRLMGGTVSLDASDLTHAHF